MLVIPVLAALWLQSPGATTAAADAPLLVVLSDTGKRMEGLPVVERIDAPEHLAVLTSGFSGRTVRLYRMAQRFAHPDRTPQPAYLVLSDNQGGFPRRGFVLDGRPQTDTAYVDLHRRSDLTGRPGAIDQIFPHELMHVIVSDLAGEAPEGRASQVHAIGVRTDRVTAFNEGFAEHAQIMAIEDPGARPETRAIATDVEGRDRAFAQLDRYRQAVQARWAIAPKARMTFLLWFSRNEQVLRYHAVKDNLFAREPDVPEHLLTPAGAYRAYLLDSVMPGRPDARYRPAARLLASEGFVSALFYRLVTSQAIQDTPAGPEFYAQFGVAPGEFDGLGNAYLKVCAAIAEGRYDAGAIIEAYARLFPAEAHVVRAVLREALGGQDQPRHPEIWLMNERFSAGTSLFDQYRALPRPQTFELNAASAAELAGVPRLDRALAGRVLDGAPYGSVEDLSRVEGMTPQVLDAFRDMRRAIETPPPPGTEQEGTLSISAIVMPYGWRALKVWLAAAVVAALLYAGVRRRRWWRLALNGLAATLAGLLAGWTIDPGNGLVALAVPLVLFGVPGSIISLWRSRSMREAAMVLGAWGLAALVPALSVVPLG